MNLSKKFIVGKKPVFLLNEKPYFMNFPRNQIFMNVWLVPLLHPFTRMKISRREFFFNSSVARKKILRKSVVEVSVPRLTFFSVVILVLANLSCCSTSSIWSHDRNIPLAKEAQLLVLLPMWQRIPKPSSLCFKLVLLFWQTTVFVALTNSIKCPTPLAAFCTKYVFKSSFSI